MIVHQMVVKSAFLHRNIDKELYMEQPELFKEHDHKDWVYRLKKGLYELKQVGHIWNKTLHNHLINHGYKPFKSEPSVHIKCNIQHDNITIIAVYIDDLQIVCNN